MALIERRTADAHCGMGWQRTGAQAARLSSALDPALTRTHTARAINLLPLVDERNCMARLPLVQDDNAPVEVRAAFEAANRFNGRVANSMRMYAHSPGILKFLLPLQAVLQKDGLGCKLDAKTRALAMIKVSALNACQY